MGECEEAIARAFREAAAEGAFLLLDEVDGLLADRGSAVHGFEVSRVNELLSAMEAHPLPFAATTNLSERLDAASARRFTFKVTFDFLTPAKARALFRHVFDREPPAALDRLATLTPGDFALVARKARRLGTLGEAEHLVALLSGECEGRRREAAPIGFVAPGPARATLRR